VLRSIPDRASHRSLNESAQRRNPERKRRLPILLPIPAIAAGRQLHRSTTISIKGENSRLKDKKTTDIATTPAV
jgi:hypothetical protein